MNARSADVKVGIAVILAAMILILGIAWIGQFRMNRHWVTYPVYFSEVGGLNSGDPVMVSGVEMGKMGPITLESGRVRTDLLLDERVTLWQDCSVEIRSVGLMGEKYIYIMPGLTGEKIPPGTVIEGKYKAGLTDLSVDMEDVMNEIKALSQAIRKFVGPDEGSATLGQSLARLNEVSTEILTLLRENRDDLRSTAKSVKSASENLNDVLGGRKAEISEGLTRFARASARLDSLTVSLKSVATSLEQGQGTLGMLIKEKNLHEEIETTLDRLNALLADIKEHPERYIKIRVF
jgi:phospholipid/cholesterol/gamma-HCH transport system substrate-binding protein